MTFSLVSMYHCCDYFIGASWDVVGSQEVNSDGGKLSVLSLLQSFQVAFVVLSFVALIISTSWSLTRLYLYMGKVDALDVRVDELVGEVGRQIALYEALMDLHGIVQIKQKSLSGDLREGAGDPSAPVLLIGRSIRVERAIVGKGREWIDATTKIESCCGGKTICRFGIPVADLLEGELGARPDPEMLIAWKCNPRSSESAQSSEAPVSSLFFAIDGRFEIIMACP
ncbi:hypothetical protein [Rhodovulum sp. P5]|uniref:hypothetical protein n=1 Tax=Rhodovulum sp. P5 TaxID=1564506 RepID=UPI0012EC0570|nr:hypothetical protein [Rhodovulum sp. P5]